MAQLAIKGHPTRGKEVIQLLEILGGENKYNLWGDAGYYVIEYGEILEGEYIFGDEQYTYFTLEEFESEFPYKVGDKVIVWIDGCRSIYNIQNMEWDSIANEIKYKIQDYWYSTINLHPYEEENMEEIEIIELITEINLNHPRFGMHNEIELIIPAGWEFEQRGNKMFGVRKQPKDYVECASLLNTFHASYIEGYKNDLLVQFQKLLICRDAYWKLAGTEMGLDKPWKPEWASGKPFYCISVNGNIIDKGKWYTDNKILAFPTKEMRDAFYKNFRELIEQCKELL